MILRSPLCFRHMKTVCAVALGSLALLTVSATVRADSPAVTLNSSSLWSSDPALILGYSFAVNANNIQATALGYYDARLDGFSGETHDVGLWDSGGNLLAMVTLDSGNQGTLIGAYRYLNLTTPVILTASQTYTVGGTNADNQTYAYTNNPADFSADPAITYDRGRYSVGSSLAFPTLTNHLLYGGANFLFSPVITSPDPVPEPGFYALSAVLALGGLGVLRRRRARRS